MKTYSLSIFCALILSIMLGAHSGGLQAAPISFKDAALLHPANVSAIQKIGYGECVREQVGPREMASSLLGDPTLLRQWRIHKKRSSRGKHTLRQKSLRARMRYVVLVPALQAGLLRTWMRGLPGKSAL
jgi:hypothetical protein